MTFKMIKPFVVELITFIIVVSVVCITFIISDSIEIIIHKDFWIVVAVVLVFVSLLSLFSRIITTGVKALVDFMFQTTKDDVYVFLDEQPYQASIFTEKNGDDGERSFGMYYLIHLEKGGEIYALISPSYVKLVEGHWYQVKSGRFSYIFLSSNPVEQHQSGDGSVIESFD